MPFHTKLRWHACSNLCCHVLSLRPGGCHDSHLLTHLCFDHMYAAVTLGCCCASQLMTHAATQGMCSTSSMSRTMYICTCVCHICYVGSLTTFLVQKITHSPTCTSTHHLCRATAGQSPGYFVDLLVRERFMTSRMERHPDCPQQALALAVNQCIVRCHTVHGVLNVVRDLLPTFDLVNTSTAMHRTARTSKLGKVSLPGLQHRPALMKYPPCTASCLRWCCQLMQAGRRVVLHEWCHKLSVIICCPSSHPQSSSLMHLCQMPSCISAQGTHASMHMLCKLQCY